MKRFPGGRAAFVALVVTIAVVVAGSSYAVLERASMRSNERDAIRIAQIVAAEAQSSRSEYGDNVVSEWRFNPTQGLRDEFDRWAWSQLVAQNRAFMRKGPPPSRRGYPWRPVYRVDAVAGRPVLHYVKANPLAPHPPFRLNELLGAVRVNVPLDAAGAATLKNASLSALLGLLVLGLGAMTLLVDNNRSHQESMTLQASYDPLTQLPNRRSLMEHVDRALGAAHRRTRMVALLHIDLDGFKPINDVKGQAAGDNVLIAAAQRLRTTVRAGEIVARLAGDDFAVLVPELEGRNDAANLAQRLINALLPVFVVDGTDFQLAASVGIAMYPDDAGDRETLVKAADDAMSAVKRAGGCRYYFADRVKVT
jgi:diguanylate cyclase (GGDEF)-like protein